MASPLALSTYRCHCVHCWVDWSSSKVQVTFVCVCTPIEHQKAVKATRAETGSDSNNETSQLLKQLGLLPSTSHIPTTKSPSNVNISEPVEEIDNTRAEPEREKEIEEKKEDNGNVDDSAFLPSERPVQKNKKKCWTCKAKLELAQRELGGCKCGMCSVLNMYVV